VALRAGSSASEQRLAALRRKRGVWCADDGGRVGDHGRLGQVGEGRTVTRREQA
jgi:hypothetical protein